MALALSGPAAGLHAPVHAQSTTTPASPEEVERALAEKRAALDTTEKRGQELQDDLKSIAAERENLNARLLETAALVQKSEAKLSAIEARLSRFEAQEKTLRASLASRHDQIAKLLSVLQRMGRNPPPVIVTRREDALAMVRSAMLLAQAFPEMREEATSLAAKLNELVTVMNGIRAESEELRAETARLTTTRTRLATFMESKKQSLTERQAELKEVRAAAAEMSKSVADLNELISRLSAEVAKNPALQEFEKESAEKLKGSVAEAPEAPPPAKKAEDTPPGDVAMLEPKPEDDKQRPSSVVELAPGGGSSLVPGEPNRFKPKEPFPSLKGRLPLPAYGRKVLNFGDKTQYGGTSKGMVLETRHSAQVTSPCDGWVVYAGEFRSYGQLLIINAGGGYHVLLAGMSEIDVEPGQFVVAAEPVGTMSGAPRTAQLAVQGDGDGVNQNTASSSAPVLYVEFRKDGQPVDPDPWWVATSKKVSN